MLRKLRIKFVIINMIFSMFMLGIVYSCIYYSTSQNLIKDSIQTMRSAAINPKNLTPPDKKEHDVRLPYFTVRTDENGDIDEYGGGYFDLSDEELINDIVSNTDFTASDVGIIEEYNLRYLRVDTPDGSCIVFSDISREQSILSNLIKSFIVVGIIFLIVVYLISLGLAHWAVKPVEKAWKQQKQFVADASHELKTPLTVIMTDAELLNSRDCTEKDRMTLSSSIMTMTSQMSGLVEGLLDLARIDNGTVKETPVQVSFSEIAADASMLFEPVFFENNMPFTYEIEPDISLKGIPTHLKQLVTIYLDNASKYASDSGATTLCLKKLSSGRCQLCVSNEGEQISDEDLPNLFKRFYRADKARAMNHSYGLGLSVAESIAQEHHGAVYAKSENGLNSFYAELPL